MDRRKSIARAALDFRVQNFISTSSIYLFCFRSFLIFVRCSYKISIQILYFLFYFCTAFIVVVIVLTSSAAAKKQQQQSCRERKFLSSVFSSPTNDGYINLIANTSSLLAQRLLQSYFWYLNHYDYFLIQYHWCFIANALHEWD